MILTRKILYLFFISFFVLSQKGYTKKNNQDSLLYFKKIELKQKNKHNIDSLNFKNSIYSINLKDTLGVFKRKYNEKVHDTTFFNRIQDLNLVTEYKYAYNDVSLKRIKRYCYEYRPYIAKILERGMYYFPIFEQTLDKYNLPIELKYLAVIESSLNPNALSRSGASGLWQFMYETGKWFDLEVTTYVDERRDPYKSTESACRYFEYLYNIFEDWELVIASYNAGPGYIKRKMKTTGCDNYWCLRPFIRQETQNYIPKFIAMSYILNYYSEHDIYPRHYNYANLKTDTFRVNQSISFEALSKFTGIPVDSISIINPVFKKQIIPVQKNSSSKIILPHFYSNNFLLYKDSIYKYSSKLTETYITKQEPVTYRVKEGDYLGKISKKYNCTVKDLMKWNNLKSTNISPGQKIIVYNPVVSKKDKKTKNTIYKVQVGDTLWGIVEKNEGLTLEELKKVNNLKSNSIKPGLKLKIPTTK